MSQCLPAHARILEIGAGTGEQSAELARRGFDVAAIDVASSNYRTERVFNVVDYDGVNLPFPDQSFDVVYSSNVLEHVGELDGFEREIRRVLRPAGRCIHLMPTPTWRLWSALTVFGSAAQAGVGLLAAVIGRGKGAGCYWRRVGWAAHLFAAQIYDAVRQPRHGERGNRFTELYYFSRSWWMHHFREAGFEIVEARPAGLFYTGYMVFGPLLSISARRRLAPWLGSACHKFVLTAAADRQEASLINGIESEETTISISTEIRATSRLRGREAT